MHVDNGLRVNGFVRTGAVGGDNYKPDVDIIRGANVKHHVAAIKRASIGITATVQSLKVPFLTSKELSLSRVSKSALKLPFIPRLASRGSFTATKIGPFAISRHARAFVRCYFSRSLSRHICLCHTRTLNVISQNLDSGLRPLESRLYPQAIANPQTLRPLSTSANMSWRSSGTSNVELVENMKRNGLINNEETYQAMKKVDRAHYAPANAYQDAPQTIGYGATISAPHMHSHACEEIIDYLKPGASILDVGSGSGYLVAVMAHMVQPGGRVVGIEHIQELVDLSIRNLRKDPVLSGWLDDGTITIIRGDGRLGYPQKAPYSAIHVGAAAKSVHKELVEQLASPGRLFIPVEASMGDQSIWHIDKDRDGKVKQEMKYGVMYVPLTDHPNGM